MVLAKRYLIALFLVFLHFAAQVRMVTSLHNRVERHWDLTQALALVGNLLLLALFATVVASVLMRLARRGKRQWLARLLDRLLVIALVSGVMAAFPFFFVKGHGTLTALVWLGAMVWLGFSLARPGRSRVAAGAAKLCLLFSPAPLLLSLQIFTWSHWADPPEAPFVPREAPSPRAPVFVIVFDAWSYARTTRDGEFRSCYPHLRALAGQSLFFRRAKSPYQFTTLSLPRLIFQGNRRLVYRRGRVYWTDGLEEVPTTEVPSLFQLAKGQGYNGYLIGWGVAYPRLLGEQVDFCRAYLGGPFGGALPEEMALCVLRNVRFWSDPISQRIVSQWNPLSIHTRQYRYRIWADRHLRADAQRVLDTCPANTFALLHMFAPHLPAIWEEDGGYVDPPARVSLPAGYQRSLKFVDHTVGQIVSTLTARGLFDPALVVALGDHAWHEEPEPDLRPGPEWRRHIPLVIKLPGQRTGRVVCEEVQTNYLLPLFQAVFAGERDTQRLDQVVREMVAAQPQEPPRSPPAGGR